MLNCNVVVTPVESGQEMEEDNNEERVDATLYKKMIGSLSCPPSYQAAWIEAVLTELGVNIQVPIKLLVENKYAINLAKNHVSHGRSKHIKTWSHYIREKVNKGRLTMRYCPTKDQIADILTKTVKGEQFSKLKIDMVVAFDSEFGMAYGSLASEALMAYESSTSKGVRGWSNMASEGVRGENYL
ncbi:hypothetical protein KIW84_064918 [Lathyrus oleraceus]|uniref:Uncharacterized protein n=1 Tax=Pisum sativum TaxID=3888 RepID=A0A9D4WFL5_PEA|nr:hypothetical protein KIW84_064918 [Pisum sativum]